MKTSIKLKVDREISVQRQLELDELKGLLGEIKDSSMADQLQHKILDRVMNAVKSGNVKTMNTV